MNDALSPRAKAFLQSVRDADEPTLADCERVHASLEAQLAVGVVAWTAAEMMKEAGAAGASVPVATASTAAGATLASKVGAAVVVASMVTGGAAAVFRLTQQPPIDAGSAALASAAASASREGSAAASVESALPTTPGNDPHPLDLGEPLAAKAPAAAQRPARAAGPAPSAFRVRAPAISPSSRATAVGATETRASPLDAEIVLLRDARAALRRGDAASALALLDVHDRRFPAGALGEDCSAARIHALCALGRVDEVRVLAAQFVAAHPVSPHAAMVRASCSAGSTK